MKPRNSSRGYSLRKRDLAVVYVLNEFFQRLCDTFAHATTNQIMSLRLNCQLLRENLEERGFAHDEILKTLKRIESSVADLSQKTHEFSRQVPDFVWFGGIDLKNMIEGQLVSFEHLQYENISVRFEYKAKKRFVFGSAFIGEHIYNILSNSRFAIAQAIASGRISEGRISIIVDDESKASTRRISKAFVRTTILDNGGGVDEDVLPRIGQFGFTTKPLHGTGYALAAAKAYFEATGGSILLANRDQGFEVTLRIPASEGETIERKITPV